MKTHAFFTLLSLLVLFSYAQDEKKWPFMYDQSSYAYLPKSNTFGVHVYNMPVSEGIEFELDFNFQNINFNRNVTGIDTKSNDFVRLIISTQWYVDQAPVRKSTDQVVELNGENGAKGVPITFITDASIPTSSHRIDFIAFTNDISADAGLTFKLTKKDKSITFLQETPFTVTTFSPSLANEMKIEVSHNKNIPGGTMYDRDIKIELNRISTEMPFATNSFTLRSSATELISFRSYQKSSDLMNDNLDDFEARCDVEVKNDKVNNGRPVVYEAILTTPPGTLGVFTIVPEDGVPSTLIPNSNLVITCGATNGRTSWTYIHYQPYMRYTPISYLLSLPSKVGTKENDAIAYGNVVLNPQLETFGTTGVRIVFIILLILFVGLTLFFIFKAVQHRRKIAYRNQVANRETSSLNRARDSSGY
jgi:hypothetical protein